MVSDWHILDVSFLDVYINYAYSEHRATTFGLVTNFGPRSDSRHLPGVLESEEIMPEVSQAWLALIGAILGGSGLKFIEHYLSRPKIKDDSATAFRNELREEVKNLREELRKTENELDDWRTKYYALVDDYSKAKRDRDTALQKIQIAADEAVSAGHNDLERVKIQEARDTAARELRGE